MRVSAAMLVALTCSLGLGTVGCGGSKPTSCGSEAERTPKPAPDVVLTEQEESVWAPLPANRSQVPVLLYHGIGPVTGFANPSDADYGVDVPDFAKQMTM